MANPYDLFLHYRNAEKLLLAILKDGAGHRAQGKRIVNNWPFLAPCATIYEFKKHSSSKEGNFICRTL
jgi:hypothetical protein